MTFPRYYTRLGHKSVRRNALIADLLHRIDFIEKAGTGIKRIRDEARAQGCPEPVFEETGFVTATFFPNPEVRAQVETKPAPGHHQVAGEVSAHDEAHDEAHELISDIEHKLLSTCDDEPRSTSDLLRVLGYEIRTGNFKIALRQMLTRGFLTMTIPDKPRSRKQRYRLTAKGNEYLKRKEVSR